MVIEKINKEGHSAAFNPVTIHCAKHGMENRRFELGPPGESKLPLPFHFTTPHTDANSIQKDNHQLSTQFKKTKRGPAFRAK